MICKYLPAWLTSGIAAWLLPAASLVGQDLSRIQESWAKRQAIVQSLSVDWRVEHYIPAGGMRDHQVVRELKRQAVAKQTGKPPEPTILDAPIGDSRTETRSELRIAGQSFRYERAILDWNDKAKLIKEVRFVSSYGDGKATDLTRNGSTDADYPGARVRATARNDELAALEIRPLAWMGADVSTGEPSLEIGQWAIDTDAPRANPGHVHLTFRFRHLVYRMIVDAEREYVPISLRSTTLENQPQADLTIEYDPCPELKWFPSKWVLRTYQNSGDLAAVRTCTTTAYAINADIPARDLDAQIPPGALVHDSSTGVDRHLFVRQDGTTATLSHADVVSTYEEVVQRHSQRRYDGITWARLLAVVGVVAIGSLGYVLWSRRRPKRST